MLLRHPGAATAAATLKYVRRGLRKDCKRYTANEATPVSRTHTPRNPDDSTKNRSAENMIAQVAQIASAANRMCLASSFI